MDFELPAYVVREGDGEVVLGVRMVGGSNINVMVIATTENGTAVGMYACMCLACEKFTNVEGYFGFLLMVLSSVSKGENIE